MGINDVLPIFTRLDQTRVPGRNNALTLEQAEMFL
jgi:hypothetical protein